MFLAQKLSRSSESYQRLEPTEFSFRVGDDCDVQASDGIWYRAIIQKIPSSDTFVIAYIGNEKETETISIGSGRIAVAGSHIGYIQILLTDIDRDKIYWMKHPNGHWCQASVLGPDGRSFVKIRTLPEMGLLILDPSKHILPYHRTKPKQVWEEKTQALLASQEDTTLSLQTRICSQQISQTTETNSTHQIERRKDEIVLPGKKETQAQDHSQRESSENIKTEEARAQTQKKQNGKARQQKSTRAKIDQDQYLERVRSFSLFVDDALDVQHLNGVWYTGKITKTHGPLNSGPRAPTGIMVQFADEQEMSILSSEPHRIAPVSTQVSTYLPSNDFGTVLPIGSLCDACDATGCWFEAKIVQRIRSHVEVLFLGLNIRDRAYALAPRHTYTDAKLSERFIEDQMQQNKSSSIAYPNMSASSPSPATKYLSVPLLPTQSTTHEVSQQLLRHDENIEEMQIRARVLIEQQQEACDLLYWILQKVTIHEFDFSKCLQRYSTKQILNYRCPFEEGQTYLHLVVKCNLESVCELMMKDFPSIAECPDKYGRYPLHIATEQGSKMMCQAMVRAHPSILHIFDHTGRLPIHIALAKEQWDLVELYVRAYPGSILAKNEDHQSTYFALLNKSFYQPSTLFLFEELLQRKSQIFHTLQRQDQCDVLSQTGDWKIGKVVHRKENGDLFLEIINDTEREYWIVNEVQKDGIAPLHFYTMQVNCQVQEHKELFPEDDDLLLNDGDLPFDDDLASLSCHGSKLDEEWDIFADATAVESTEAPVMVPETLNPEHANIF